MNFKEGEIINVKGLEFSKLIDRSELDKVTQKVADQITADFKDKNPLFIGVLNGAFVWTADLVRKLGFHELEVEWTKVSSYQKDQSSGVVKSLIGLKVPIKDRHVIIVEDIVDSGKTMSEVMPNLQKEGPASLQLATLFFKKECCKYDVPIKYIGMEIPDKFIIGYGIDYDEGGRNLPDVWGRYIKEEEGKEKQ